MTEDWAQVVAAAPGTIVMKQDGFFDRECSLGARDWNAIYIQHSDGSVTWYGHLKAGSLTDKSAGDEVAAGEFLGIVGSSGNDDPLVRIAGLQSMHQLATVANELEMKRIERDRLEERAGFLTTLAAQLANQSVPVSAIAGDAGLTYLAMDAGKARATIAAASQTIADKSVEAENLASEIDAMTAELATARQGALARARTNEQTVLFVPASNAQAFEPGSDLESCRFIIAGCAAAGRTGERIAGDVTQPHPLFGNPVRGHFVAVELNEPLSGAARLVRAVH